MGTGQAKFDIYFSVLFDCYCQTLIFGMENGHYGMSPPKFNIFLFPKILSCSATPEATRMLRLL